MTKPTECDSCNQLRAQFAEAKESEEAAWAKRRLYFHERRFEAMKRALQAAIHVWCPRGHPGGDGADGETYELCMKALTEPFDGKFP